MQAASLLQVFSYAKEMNEKCNNKTYKLKKAMRRRRQNMPTPWQEVSAPKCMLRYFALKFAFAFALPRLKWKQVNLIWKFGNFQSAVDKVGAVGGGAKADGKWEMGNGISLLVANKRVAIVAQVTKQVAWSEAQVYTRVGKSSENQGNWI